LQLDLGLKPIATPADWSSMSMELTSRFLDRLRVIELITALCILASLSFVLIAYSGDGPSSSAPAATKYERADGAALHDMKSSLADANRNNSRDGAYEQEHGIGQSSGPRRLG
jgi:hypothetical protein